MTYISFRVKKANLHALGEKKDSRPVDGYSYPYKLGREFSRGTTRFPFRKAGNDTFNGG